MPAATIAHIAQLADDLIAALREKPFREHRADREADREDIARGLVELGSRIRALRHSQSDSEAVAILREIRPSIAGAMETKWKAEILARIDAVLSE